MRITSNTTSRKYISHLERNFANKNASENRIDSNRKFSRASEDPISAAKAMKVRKAMANLETYNANLDTAKSIYETAESSIMHISELMQSTYEKLIYGADGTLGEADNKIVAESIDTFADEMTRLLNLTVADRRIFGGTNTTTNAFAITGEGDPRTVTYNGVPVNNFEDPSMFPSSKPSYADIGIGMTLGEDGRVVDQSALQVTFNGAELVGCGLKGSLATLDLTNLVTGGQYMLDVTAGNQFHRIAFTAGSTDEQNAADLNVLLAEKFGDGALIIDPTSGIIKNNISESIEIKNTDVSKLKDADGVLLNPSDYETAGFDISSRGYANNIIQLTLDAASCLRKGDKLGAAKFADQVFSAQTNLSLSIAQIGNKEEFIDFNQTRITNNNFTLSEQQNTLEGTDLAVESTNWKVYESVYNATLQMSAAVIPQSIFQFMR